MGDTIDPSRTGLFLDMFRFGGADAPPIIFAVCGPIATKFCTGIDNQSISSNMEKNSRKINDVIMVRKLAERTIKRVYFKISAASSFFIESY